MNEEGRNLRVLGEICGKIGRFGEKILWLGRLVVEGLIGLVDIDLFSGKETLGRYTF